MPKDAAFTTWWLFLDLAEQVNRGDLAGMPCLLKPCRVQFSDILAGPCVCQCGMHRSETAKRRHSENRQHLLAKGSWRCSFETATRTQPPGHAVSFTSAGLTMRTSVSTRHVGSWWPSQQAARSAAAC